VLAQLENPLEMSSVKNVASDDSRETVMKLTCRAALVMSVLACNFLTTGALAHGDTPRPRRFLQTAMAPDGTRVAWVEETVDSAGEATGSAIVVQDLRSPDSGPRRISAAEGGNPASEDTIAWAPDSRHLAFLSDAGSREQSQFYVADLDGRGVRKLTSLSGSLAAPAWSADGKVLAFLFTENAPRANPLMPMAEETGVIADKIYEQRLAVVNVAADKVRQLSPPDMYVYEYDWSPDGKSFAAIAAHGAGDANWYVAQLYTLGSEGGELQPVYKPKLQIAMPRWSPNGQSIAFIEGLMSDEGFTGGDIYVVSKTGGGARDVTPGLAASPAGIYWRLPGNIHFTEDVDGQVGISTVDLATGKISPLWTGSGAITDGFWGGTTISLSSDARNAAAIRHSWEHPAEIWAGPVSEWKQLTSSNSGIRPAWGEMKSLHWTSDGMKIQGWLMYPKNYDPARRYPMVVEAHGGPAGAAHTGWPEQFFNTLELSARGYFVFYPNPRGSFGQGENFTTANVKDFGYGDFRDILAGVDEVIKTLPVDGNRIGITGWSYGGYMTMWAVTQTNRFRAAVAGAGLANWQSYYGENDIDEWMIPYFGASVYDDPAIYARSAPMTFIKNVKTPTLVLVGERDGECPAPQSREFWHALKTQGVQTELVVYSGEGHVFNQPDHERDVMERLIKWFDHYLKPESAAGN
jgi:dipeptidyl aminopeptidase/acylaminoacyl peptidase